ncbi:response regulator [Rossellomorea aquimaris]|uniref:Response regulator n=1 Tax=Rossellomorea aquimaris TaxID=189382 RepID=A0A5D4UM13_9BACI|nr:response regulator [Rossellomorea aquimaris]TYS81699.1 response regulator [Rossellomorea aquimaris]TYS88324.1 response regulator [Rossellomorea aquimaris]
MYNVMIVDDEPIIRFGLKSSIDWEDKNLHLIGDFSNGKQALEAMERTGHVDILITDIKMPVMDGITLMKKALQMYPKLKVVLVSSYNEFEYVREGLTHGAVDYILKQTLEPDQFSRTIHKCIDKLLEEEKVTEKLDHAEQTNKINERRRTEQSIKRVLLRKMPYQDCEQRIESLPMPQLLLLGSIKELDRFEDEFGFLYKNLIIEEIQDRFYRETEDGYCFPIGENELIFFLGNTEEPRDTVNKLKERIEKETSLKLVFSYAMVSDPEKLVEGYHHASLAGKQYFFQSNTEIFPYERGVKMLREPLSLEEIKAQIHGEESLENFLEVRFVHWKEEDMLPDNVKKEAGYILKALYWHKVEVSVLMDYMSNLASSETMEELTGLFHEAKNGCDFLLESESKHPNTDNELLDKALSYIHHHFTQEMTLQHVADHIHISRNYFSILFKRFMDINFIDYVIGLRINKAKELLSHTSLKVYEVAGESGFNDVKYFSKLFKKVTGLSPGDYRTEHHK